MNRAERRPLSGHDFTLRLQRRMMSVVQEPPKRDSLALSGRPETVMVSDPGERGNFHQMDILANQLPH